MPGSPLEGTGMAHTVGQGFARPFDILLQDFYGLLHSETDAFHLSFLSK